MVMLKTWYDFDFVLELLSLASSEMKKEKVWRAADFRRRREVVDHPSRGISGKGAK